MTDGQHVQQLLTGAEQSRTEHRSLEQRLVRLNDQVTQAEQAVNQARTQLADEAADVARLESYSPTRILAALKGDRSERLAREKAEHQAAEYVVATAEAKLAHAIAEREAVVHRISSLGDVDAAWEQALNAKEQWLSAVDPDTGARATALSAQIGQHQAELKELREAQQAHGHAVTQLREAAEFLGSAKSWSTYDAWFDGGLFADLHKHKKLDEASIRMRAADQALRHLGTELADIRLAPVGELGITELTKTFDVWFDNIFSDFAVRNRIVESIERVNGALHTLRALKQQLDTMQTATQHKIEHCRTEREALLRHDHPDGERQRAVW